MTSLSTRFLGQPRLTKPIFMRLGTILDGIAAASILTSGTENRPTVSKWRGILCIHASRVSQHTWNAAGLSWYKQSLQCDSSDTHDPEKKQSWL